ncbi:VOC family protein [Rhodococcus koreensis]|uniref:VOC family protein n=1 Tax=Rhodococcus koreensis TaxID=99653 RepID=UPI00366DBE8E
MTGSRTSWTVEYGTVDIPEYEPTPLPPPAAVPAERPSAAAARSPITHLRYVAIAGPRYDEAVGFAQGIWGLHRTAADSDVSYFGAVASTEPYLLRVRRAEEARTDLISFGGRSVAAIDELAERLARDGYTVHGEPGESQEPGAGYAMRFFDPDGRIIEVTHGSDTRSARELEPGESVPGRLSHVVVNSENAQRLVGFYCTYLGFRISDFLTERMTFLRCSSDHHSFAVTQTNKTSLNHISFEMRGIDEYMRGAGRLINRGHQQLWGPGRHGPGNNTFAYFADPNNNVVEYTTALDVIEDEDTWIPRVWPETGEYRDQWGTGGLGDDLFALRAAQRSDAGLWVPIPF